MLVSTTLPSDAPRIRAHRERFSFGVGKRDRRFPRRRIASECSRVGRPPHLIGKASRESVRHWRRNGVSDLAILLQPGNTIGPQEVVRKALQAGAFPNGNDAMMLVVDRTKRAEIARSRAQGVRRAFGVQTIVERSASRLPGSNVLRRATISAECAVGS